ncbi:MAG: YhfC family glutamic-type intramembrane protease [Chloroflexota bacterium]
MIYLLLAINALLMIGLPIVLGLFVARRFQQPWKLFGIGAATFVLSQIGHLPFNFLLLNPWVEGFVGDGQVLSRVILVALALGLSAGVFEEAARYLTFRFWAKEARDWASGLMVGAGHGGIEAIILGVLAAVGIVNVYLILTGSLESLVPADAAGQAVEQLAAAQEQVQELVNGPRYVLLLGALERVFALILHLSLSLMVLQTFIRRNIGWLLAAIGWHAIVNAAAVAGQISGWTPLQIEAMLGITAVISLFIIVWLRKGQESAPGAGD